jgi:GTP-binding protein
LCDAVLAELKWDGPAYLISALQGEGTQKLCQEIMVRIEERAKAEADDPSLLERERALQVRMQLEAREKLEQFNAMMRERRKKQNEEDDDDWDDDEADCEYAP